MPPYWFIAYLVISCIVGWILTGMAWTRSTRKIPDDHEIDYPALIVLVILAPIVTPVLVCIGIGAVIYDAWVEDE